MEARGEDFSCQLHARLFEWNAVKEIPRCTFMLRCFNDIEQKTWVTKGTQRCEKVLPQTGLIQKLQWKNWLDVVHNPLPGTGDSITTHTQHTRNTDTTGRKNEKTDGKIWGSKFFHQCLKKGDKNNLDSWKKSLWCWIWTVFPSWKLNSAQSMWSIGNWHQLSTSRAICKCFKFHIWCVCSSIGHSWAWKTFLTT